MKLLLLQIKLAFAISLASLGFMPVQAQSVKPVIRVPRPMFNSSRQLNKPMNFILPPPPKGINAPGNRIGGGKRGCGNMDKQLIGSNEKLTALVPVYGPPDSELVLGLTTAKHPTFWFYVPYSSIFSAEFVLQNEAGENIYPVYPVSLSGTPGIVSFSLPSTAPPLEIGKRYHWYFNINCGQESISFVDGWITRNLLFPALKSKLETATPRERVALFADKGMWYDALTASAELRRVNPKDTSWAAMLEAVGLNDISSELITECCQQSSAP